jgi:hypothetical protein
VSENFNGEIHTLAYPKAALFSFSMALVAYNILATLRTALGSVHGVGKIEAGLSDFYLVDEIQSTYRGMMIAIPSPHWASLRTISLTQMALLLQHLAAKVNLKCFLRGVVSTQLIQGLFYLFVPVTLCIKSWKPEWFEWGKMNLIFDVVTNNSWNVI